MMSFVLVSFVDVLMKLTVMILQGGRLRGLKRKKGLGASEGLEFQWCCSHYFCFVDYYCSMCFKGKVRHHHCC